tara:strand:- start:16412 stop:17491 length:1080 start_codon:yes stop_codon:yes gene_type:complete
VQLETRPNYDCYVNYFWPKSEWLEENCLIGDLDYLGPEADKNVNDPLMQNIPAYNCVSRTYEGFNNVNQDLNYGVNQQVFSKRPADVQERVKNYVTDKWSLLEYVYAYYVHRSTGSGFYAGKDWHGYHHSIVSHFGLYETVEEMAELMKTWKAADRKMFSTIGNQNPTPIKGLNLPEHITTFGLELMKELTGWLEENLAKDNGAPLDQKELTDRLNQKNIDRGVRRWNFPYAQMIADIATYHPEYVDPNSSLYCGNNARQAIEQMFRRPKGMSEHVYHDLALANLTERLGTNAVAHEDTLCIYVRFLNNLDRSGRGLTNASGYYMMNKDDTPMHPDIWRPEAYQKKVNNSSHSIMDFLS